MRKYIDIVTSNLLLEAQRYEDMFNAVLKITGMLDQEHAERYSASQKSPEYKDYDDDIKAVIDDRATGTAKTRAWSEEIAENISWAKYHLKRQDRITWFLRLYRLALMRIYGEPHAKTDPTPAVLAARQLYAKLYREYLSQLTPEAASWDDPVTMRDINYLKRDFEHFLSLPIAKIQQYVLNRQTMSEFYRDMNKLERAWQEETRNTIAPTREDDIILAKKIGEDEWCWVNLHRAYCSKEADAMGHCGNKPAEYTDQKILSLRKKIERGNTFLWKPYATFILHPDGSLGEMKGRFNEKPGHHGEREAVMAMIKELLKSPIVTRLAGGGHAPHQNFALGDLSPKDREELLATRPELGNAYHYLKTKGYDETFSQMLEDEISNKLGRDVEDVNDNYTTIETFQDMTRLVNGGDPYIRFEGYLKDLTEIEQWDYVSLDLDSLDDLRHAVMNNNEYATLREKIDDIDEVFDQHEEQIDMLRENICQRISTNVENYLLKWYNLLPFHLTGLHFVRNDDKTIEARISTEALARGLDLLENGNNDEFYEDAPSLNFVAQEGWFDYDGFELNAMMRDDLYGALEAPEAIMARLRSVTVKLITRGIERIVKT